MLSKDTEQILVKILLNISKHEKSNELIRLKIINDKSYDLNSIFRFLTNFDKFEDNNNYINEYNFYEFLT